MLETDGGETIIVDCGLVPPSCREERNALVSEIRERVAAVSGNAAGIVLTHAHYDHTGGWPAFYEDASKQLPTFGHPTTRSIEEIVLKGSDSFVRKMWRADSVKRAMSSYNCVGYGEEFPLSDAIVSLHDAGHIPGSAEVRMDFGDGKRVVFSGDIHDEPLFYAPGRSFGGVLETGAISPEADILVVESTLAGDIIPPFDESYSDLENALLSVAEKGERAVIASNPIRKQQEMAYLVTTVFDRHPDEFDGYELISVSGNGKEFFKEVYPDLYRQLAGRITFRTRAGPLFCPRDRCVFIGSGGWGRGKQSAYLASAAEGADGWNAIQVSGYPGEGETAQLLDAAKDNGRCYSARFESHAGTEGLLRYVESRAGRGALVIVNHASDFTIKSAEALASELKREGYRNVIVPENGAEMTF